MDTQNGTTPTLDLEPAARQIAGLLDGIEDRYLTDPTPCPDYAVRELLAHLVGLATAFRDAGRKNLGPTTDTSPDAALPVLPEGWREALPPLLDELVIHGWDLARSTGQKYEADEASLRVSLALMTPSDDSPRLGQPFGPPFPVAADAPLVDRAVAMSGRRPDWQPGD